MASTPSDPAAPWQRLRGYFWPHRWPLLGSVLIFLLASATEPLIPKLLQIALDEGFMAEPSFPLWAVPLTLIGLFAARGVLSFSGTWLLSRCTSSAVLALRKDLAEALLRADAPLFSRLSPGLMVNKVIADPQTIANQLGGAIGTLLRDGTTAVALLIYLFWHNWQLTALSLVSVPLLAFGVRVVQRRIKRVGAEHYDAQSRLTAVVDDLVRAWRVIRSFDAVAYERARFERQAQQVQRWTMKSAAAGALMTPVSQLASSLGIALITTLALYQAQSQGSSVGNFAAYIAALLLLVSRTRHLSDLSQPVLAALVTARACFELLDAPPEADTGTRQMPLAQGRIELQQVTLRYPGAEMPALNRLSLTVQAGETVALVGASGSGKSTLVSALLGFASPQAGQVLLDGVPIHELRKAELRRHFTVVSQDIELFDASFAENVAYAQALDLTRVESCLRAAALWEHVASMPEGMQATIGINGSRLSGGQRQRLAIARALYKDAPVWILDEATSALDSESEQAIQQALLQWRGRKTLIVIAHRLSTIREADAIHVLHEGRIIEGGSHAQLMAQGGRYAAMVAAQSSGADAAQRD